MARSTHPARLIVGGLYLLKALLAALGLALALAGIAPGVFIAPIHAGVGALLATVVLGGMALLWGSIGIGLLKGSRIALAIAIVVAGLNGLACLADGHVVGFAVEALIFCGLLLSRDVRAAYSR
jgi:hypothetical protein